MIQTMNTIKYPRTPHLPTSPGFTADDIVSARIALPLLTSNVVVTEKLDGENTCMARRSIHARSQERTTGHPARHYVTALWGRIAHLIPDHMLVFGENLYAKHAIAYSDLPDYFVVFAVVNEFNGLFLDWQSTCAFAADLGLPTVPVLYQGTWNHNAIAAAYTGISRFGGEQEGYVVRVSHTYQIMDHATHTAKWVRAGHVAADAQHWTQQAIIKNGKRK
jgi:hypothetical protein